MRDYRARWSVSLYLMSTIGVLVLGGLAAGTLAAPGLGFGIPLVAAGFSLLILVGCAGYAILGYTITPDEVVIRHPGWDQRYLRTRIHGAEADSKAMSGSLRTLGNGGLFSFSGRFWNKKLGHYKAYVTDPADAVVLRYDDGVLVISPDDPQAFVEALGY